MILTVCSNSIMRRYVDKPSSTPHNVQERVWPLTTSLFSSSTKLILSGDRGFFSASGRRLRQFWGCLTKSL